MRFSINVRGGTRAGWLTVKQQAHDWVCPSCGKRHKYYWTECPVDGTPRPC